MLAKGSRHAPFEEEKLGVIYLVLNFLNLAATGAKTWPSYSKPKLTELNEEPRQKEGYPWQSWPSKKGKSITQSEKNGRNAVTATYSSCAPESRIKAPKGKQLQKAGL